MRIKTRNKVNVSFSMSGMTDIVFLLLLFFMITSTMIAPNALKLLLPQQGNSTENPRGIPEVRLMGEGIIYLDGSIISIEEMEPALIQKLSGINDPVFKLITTENVTVKETVAVMSAAAKNNLKVVLIKE